MLFYPFILEERSVLVIATINLPRFLPLFGRLNKMFTSENVDILFYFYAGKEFLKPIYVICCYRNKNIKR